jgi:hypothetical protein
VRCADQRRVQRRNRTLVPALHGPGASQRDALHQQRRFMESRLVQKDLLTGHEPICFSL